MSGTHKYSQSVFVYKVEISGFASLFKQVKLESSVK